MWCRFYANPLRPSSGNKGEDAEEEDDVDTNDLFVLYFYDLAAKKEHTLYNFIKM